MIYIFSVLYYHIVQEFKRSEIDFQVCIIYGNTVQYIYIHIHANTCVNMYLRGSPGDKMACVILLEEFQKGRCHLT